MSTICCSLLFGFLSVLTILGSYIKSFPVTSFGFFQIDRRRKMCFRFPLLCSLLFDFVSLSTLGNIEPLHLLLHELLSFRYQGMIFFEVSTFEVFVTHLEYRVELLLVFNLCLLSALICALVGGQNTWGHVVQALLGLCCWRFLMKSNLFSSLLSEISLNLVEAPVDANIRWLLLGLLVNGIFSSRDTVFEWFLLLLEDAFLLSHIERILWIYITSLYSFLPIPFLDCFGLHGSCLLVEVVLQLLKK